MQTAQFQLHAEIEDRHWWFVARRQILTAVVNSILPPDRRTTIVDVGCGTGANLAALANQYDCVGIDASSDAVRFASARFPQVRFFHGLAPRDLGEVMDRAKLVLLTDVLEHVADDFQMFSELLAAAAPGTYFLVTVPADMRLWTQHDRAFGHYRRYDLDRLRHLWQGLPAAPVFATYFNSRLFPVVKTIRAWNRRRGQTAGAAGTDFRLPSPISNALLTRCFAGERHKIVRLAQGKRAKPYRHGVSLMALVKRLDGPIDTRRKPRDVEVDHYDPVVDLVLS